MDFRYVELLGLTALVDGQMIEVDLDMADPVSELLLDLRVTQGAAAASTEHNLACFSKIEITDGSDVLFSIDGLELQALDIYHSGVFPRGGWFHYLSGIASDAQVAISFGRYLYDEDLAFDPKKFTNPKLRVTFNSSLGGAAVSGGQISVLAALFDEKVVSPTGFLMTKEIKRWSRAVTGHEYTDMPTDHPYRKVMLQGRLASVPPHWIFANIKLASDQDKKVIFNGEFRDLMFGPARLNAYISENCTAASRANLDIKHITPTMDVMATVTGWAEADAVGVVDAWNGDGGALEIISAAAGNVNMRYSGWAPHGTLAIPFGNQDNIADWFDVRNIGSLKLDITSGNADAVQKLFIQQYRAY